MLDLSVIGVPFDGYGRPGHQASAAGVLRESGLVASLLSSGSCTLVADDDLDLPDASPRRGPETTLINEAALVAVAEHLDARVRDVLASGGFPVVIGGDCTTLLGTVPALAAHRGGLLFVDGHEDTMPLDVSEDGEAANAEIGLLLGLTGRSLRGPLAERLATLPADRLALLGPRDVDWRRRFNVGSLRDHGVWMLDHVEVAQAPAEAGRGAVRHLQAHAPGWWLHVDLDVLDPEVFPAQGLPDVPDEPGGLTWPELSSVATAAIAERGCLGLSVAIYDPDQDPGRHGATAVIDLVAEVVGAAARVGSGDDELPPSAS